MEELTEGIEILGEELTDIAPGHYPCTMKVKVRNKNTSRSKDVFLRYEVKILGKSVAYIVFNGYLGSNDVEYISGDNGSSSKWHWTNPTNTTKPGCDDVKTYQGVEFSVTN